MQAKLKHLNNFCWLRKKGYLKMYFTGDTLYLSDIDMINGTPVLDIKPCIPDYDSPHTRKGSDPHLHNLLPFPVPVNQTSDGETSSDVESKESGGEKTEDLFTERVSADGPVSSQVASQFPPTNRITTLLEDVKLYLNQSNTCQVGHDSENEVSPPKTEPLESTVGHVSFGEEAYSAIAGWIRAPPVGSLEVRFTPLAEKELAEFLPSHLAGQ